MKEGKHTRFAKTGRRQVKISSGRKSNRKPLLTETIFLTDFVRMSVSCSGWSWWDDDVARLGPMGSDRWREREEEEREREREHKKIIVSGWCQEKQRQTEKRRKKGRERERELEEGGERVEGENWKDAEEVSRKLSWWWWLSQKGRRKTHYHDGYTLSKTWLTHTRQHKGMKQRERDRDALWLWEYLDKY